MSEVRIAAEPRTEFGKGGARRTRRAGKVPAVIYGHGQAPRHIAMPARDFSNIIKQGINTLISIDLDGKSELVLPKAIQRDPLKGTIDHADLLLVRRGEKVTVEIRINLIGEQARGGMVNQEQDTLTVEAEATHIPEGVEVSIEGLEVGQHILAKDVTLPKGTTLASDPDAQIIGIIAAPSAEQMEAELGGEPAAESEAAEPVEAGASAS